MIDYKIIKSDRKSVSVQVTETGNVIVRIPNSYPEFKVKRLVSENTDWIIKAQEKQRNNMNRKIDLNYDQIGRLKELAKKRINEKVEYYSMIMGVKPTGVKITSAKKVSEAVMQIIPCAFHTFLCYTLMRQLTML